MSFNFETIIFASIIVSSLAILFLLKVRKRKRSAESIYKLIDDLEKKYIY